MVLVQYLSLFLVLTSKESQNLILNEEENLILVLELVLYFWVRGNQSQFSHILFWEVNNIQQNELENSVCCILLF